MKVCKLPLTANLMKRLVILVETSLQSRPKEEADLHLLLPLVKEDRELRLLLQLHIREKEVSQQLHLIQGEDRKLQLFLQDLIS